MPKHDQVPDVKVAVSVAGDTVAIISFWKVAFNPQEWDVTAAIIDRDSREAIRACLLAAVAEFTASGWQDILDLPESGGEDGDQSIFPW